jgi:putative flippase GtrA
MVATFLARLKQNAHAVLSHSVTGEFLRYFASGLLALAVDFSLYVLLTEYAGWHYLVSATAAFLAGLSTVYVLSITWVFSNRRIERGLHEFALFAAIGLAGLALTTAVLYALTDVAGLDYRLSKVVSTALVFMFNFGCRKIFLFR